MEKKYVNTKVVILTNGQAKIRESAFESINHSQVWENQVKTLGFYSEQDANYFVENWNSNANEMNDYKEACPTEQMKFVVYTEFNGKIIEDVIFKPENWKPYKR